MMKGNVTEEQLAEAATVALEKVIFHVELLNDSTDETETEHQNETEAITVLRSLFASSRAVGQPSETHTQESTVSRDTSLFETYDWSKYAETGTTEPGQSTFCAGIEKLTNKTFRCTQKDPGMRSPKEDTTTCTSPFSHSEFHQAGLDWTGRKRKPHVPTHANGQCAVYSIHGCLPSGHRCSQPSLHVGNHCKRLLEFC